MRKKFSTFNSNRLSFGNSTKKQQKKGVRNPSDLCVVLKMDFKILGYFRILIPTAVYKKVNRKICNLSLHSSSNHNIFFFLIFGNLTKP